MKRYIALVAVAMTAICTSCSKDNEIEKVTTPTQETQEVTIKFSDDLTTRTFFDANAQAESWERSVSKAAMIFHVCSDMSGTISESVRRVLTSDEITSGEITLPLTTLAVGGLIFAEIGANVDVPNIDEMEAGDIYSDVVKYIDITDYNGAFNEVAYGAMRDDGFAMTGAGIVIVESTDAIEVPIALERTVAKVAIQTTISDQFNNPSYFSGDLRVDNIMVQSADFYNTGFVDCFTYTQASNKSGSYYQNLFYVPHTYNNQFVVSATYDADGNFSTTSDQTPVTYKFSVESTPGVMQELKSNCYYRVSVKINSMETTDVGVSISVAPWATVSDHTVEIG